MSTAESRRWQLQAGSESVDTRECYVQLEKIRYIDDILRKQPSNLKRLNRQTKPVTVRVQYVEENTEKQRHVENATRTDIGNEINVFNVIRDKAHKLNSNSTNKIYVNGIKVENKSGNNKRVKHCKTTHSLLEEIGIDDVNMEEVDAVDRNNDTKFVGAYAGDGEALKKRGRGKRMGRAARKAPEKVTLLKAVDVVTAKLQCDICPYETISKDHMSKHLQAHAAETSFHCTKCHYRTVNKYYYRHHLRTHSDEKPFVCKICNQAFSVRSGLRNHLKLHAIQMPYSCDICLKTFHIKFNYQRHLKIHTNERPFSCHECEKSFTEKRNLERHLLHHTGTRPYACDLCKKTFIQKLHLEEHMITHSGEKPFSCDQCGKLFKLKSSQIRHLRLHTDEKQY